jgi:hypothetical protein
MTVLVEKTVLVKIARLLSLLLLAGWLAACSLGNLQGNLGAAILNNDDLVLVGKGLPTYMLMMDGMVKTWPDDEGVLESAARIYSAYAGIFAENKQQAGKLSEKALGYAMRAACADDDDLCHADTQPLPDFEKALADTDDDDLSALFTLGSTWAGWIQLNSGDWNAIAQLARVRMIMERVVAIDSGYNFGQAHMYLGVLHSLLPKALGGEPDKAKVEFEQAIELSSGKNLLAKVLYAKQYARMTGNKKLFDSLLTQVEDADPHANGLTLQNVYAQELAKQLKADAVDGF